MSERTRVSDTELTCTFAPEEYATYWDENDVEHETEDPDEYCAYFVCSKWWNKRAVDGSWNRREGEADA